MYKSIRFLLFITLLFITKSPLFCGTCISAFTEQKIDEFFNLQLTLMTCGDNTEALRQVEAFAKDTSAQLPENASDLAQETLILDSLYAMQRYDYLLDPSKNRKELRSMIKSQMKKNNAWLSEHETDGSASKWIYLVSGDVISFYMTRSVAATIRYGMKVKRLYEKALALDPALTTANINLGNWLFYAPKIAGGGVDKAGERYGLALGGARNASERYLANLSLSQYWFEKKDTSLSEAYLQKASEENPGSTQITDIRKMNQNGVSLFAYKRNQCGIDEEMSEAEKDADDR